MYVLSVSPEEAPDESEYLQLLFEKGNCIGLAAGGMEEILNSVGDVTPQGREGDYTLLNPYGVMRVLNFLGGKHGIGRIDMVENRFVGMKSRGIYETPGGTILLTARRAMESITLDRGAQHTKDEMMPRYAELVYNGFWFSPEREMLQAAIDSCRDAVNGVVRVKLYKGNVIVTGRQSPNSLYNADLVTFEEGAVDYDHSDAHGFIRLNALRLRVQQMMRTKGS
jgi:argininosuccinate synthase